MDNQTKITALYTRNALKDPEKIKMQMEYTRLFADSKGFQNVQDFSDDGFSGMNCNRPGLQAMMDMVHAGKVEVIVVKDLSRLLRNCKEALALMNDIRQHEVRFIAIDNDIDVLPEHIHDEKTGITYTLKGDYYFPDILTSNSEDPRPIGKWGQMYCDYLEKEHPGLYTRMLLSGKLHTVLADTNEAAIARLEQIVTDMKLAEGVTEALKATDQMEWVRHMNSIRNRAEEIIISELIYN